MIQEDIDDIEKLERKNLSRPTKRKNNEPYRDLSTEGAGYHFSTETFYNNPVFISGMNKIYNFFYFSAAPC